MNSIISIKNLFEKINIKKILGFVNAHYNELYRNLDFQNVLKY